MLGPIATVLKNVIMERVGKVAKLIKTTLAYRSSSYYLLISLTCKKEV
jgi:hypothetical protein